MGIYYVYNLFKKNPRYFILPALFDILFIIVYGFFYNEIIAKILAKFADLMVLTNNFKITPALLLNPDIGLLTEKTAELQSLRTNIFYNIFLLVLATYICWCIFQGINWYFAKRYNKEKIKFWHYLLRFSLNNLLIVFCFVVIVLLVVKTTFMLPIMPKTIQIIILVIGAILAFIVCFIAPVTYVKGSFWKSFKFSAKNFPELFIEYVKIAILFIAILSLMKFVMPLLWLNFLIGFLIFIPALNLSRVYLNYKIQKMKP